MQNIARQIAQIQIRVNQALQNDNNQLFQRLRARLAVLYSQREEIETQNLKKKEKAQKRKAKKIQRRLTRSKKIVKKVKFACQPQNLLQSTRMHSMRYSEFFKAELVLNSSFAVCFRCQRPLELNEEVLETPKQELLHLQCAPVEMLRKVMKKK